MHFRGDSVREIPFMLFLGLLFAVTVGWWVFLTLMVSVVYPIPMSSVFQTGQKGLLTCTRF